MGRFGNGVRCMEPGDKRLDQLGRDVVAKRLPYHRTFRAYRLTVRLVRKACGV